MYVANLPAPVGALSEAAETLRGALAPLSAGETTRAHAVVLTALAAAYGHVNGGQSRRGSDSTAMDRGLTVTRSPAPRGAAAELPGTAGS